MILAACFWRASEGSAGGVIERMDAGENQDVKKRRKTRKGVGSPRPAEDVQRSPRSGDLRLLGQLRRDAALEARRLVLVDGVSLGGLVRGRSELVVGFLCSFRIAL